MRKEALSKILVTILKKFYDAVIERQSYELHPLHDLKAANQLTYSEYNNLQKLQYWGLLVKGNETGKWILTHTAKEFLAGTRAMAKYIYVSGGHKVNEELERVMVRDVMGSEYTPVVLMRDDYSFRGQTQLGLGFIGSTRRFV